MALTLDLGPVDHLTVGTVGPPGRRVFYLQAAQGRTLVSFIFEKEQARALAHAVRRLLEARGHPWPQEDPDPDPFALRQPLEPLFRIGDLALGHDEERGLFFLWIEEMRLPLEEEGEEGTEEGGERGLVRIWVDADLLGRMARHALRVVAAGRPTCPLCGRPIDPEGHFCPPRNGHRVN